MWLRLFRLATCAVDVKPDEEEALQAGFLGFFLILAAYFVLLPLRDDAAVALGTAALPPLFVGSLLATLAAAPATSAFLSAHAARRERGLQRFYAGLGASMLVVLVLYVAADTPAAAARSLAGSDPTLEAPPGAPPLGAAQRAVRAAFFLWMSLLNLVAVSAMWARAADVFGGGSAAARLFGALGAGATLGQLAGSLLAAWLVRVPLPSAGGRQSAPLAPLLAAAALFWGAGRCMLRLKPSAAAAAAVLDPELQEPAAPGSSSSGLGPPAKQAAGPASAGRAAQHGLRAAFASVLEGYAVIRASPYLRSLCLFLVLNYVVSSAFFFLKTLAAAELPGGAAGRTSWFAAINSASAAAVLVVQLVATGRVLRRLGAAASLAVTPAVCCALLAGVALAPTSTMVALAEVARKVLTYSLARPARETLFTVVPREDKYRAKIFIDSVVQRLGDALAAGAFQLLVPAAGFGAAGLAAACVPAGLAWCLLGWRLGAQQAALARAQLKRKVQLVQDAGAAL